MDWNNGRPNLPTGFSGTLPNSCPSRSTMKPLMPLSKSASALAPFVSDPRWRPAQDEGVRAWTDGYTDIVGAMIGQMLHHK